MRTSLQFFRYFLLSFCLLIPLAAHAQNQQPSELLVNYFEVNEQQDTEGNDALHMDLFFTVLDENGAVIADADVDSAEILVDGARYPAAVEKPTTPLFIALALDTSGSMREAADDMRQAAIAAIENAPLEAQISIVQFNEEISISGFNDRGRAAAQVNAIEISDRGTCLYDAAFKSVQAVNLAASNVPVARRAVIFFTDGRDERTAGQGDTCSTNTFEQVVALASDPQSPVPIHTIGLGNVDPRLPEMSQTTGGLNAIGAEGNLSSAFGAIMDGLLGQLLAAADMYPSAGRKSATIEVLLRNDLLLTESIVFESPRDFDPPPEPLAVQRTNLVYDEAADAFSFDIAMEGTIEEIAALQLLVVADDGTQVAEYEFAEFAPPFSFGADGLTAEQDYNIEIYALDSAGNLLQTDRGNALLDSAEFEYRPPVAAVPPTPTPQPDPAVLVQPIDINVAEQTMTIETLVENPDQIDRYEVQIVNRDTGDLIETISADFSTSNSLQLPLSQLGEGQFRVIVNAFDADGSLVADSEQDISYTPPAAPGFFARVRRGFADNPILPGAIVGILLLLIGFFMLRSLLEKRNTGTPFLQKQGVKPTAPAALPISQTMNVDRDQLRQAMADQTLMDAPRSGRGGGAQTLMDPRSVAPSGPTLVVRVIASMDGTMADESFSINHYPFTIGRENCDLTFANDPHMSRNHAEVSFENGNFYITDLASSNGVLLGETRIPKLTPTPIPPGKHIGLGKSTTVIFGRG